MPNELIPMSTWTPKDGQTYEIVDAEARERLDDAEERLDDLEQGGTGSGTVKSVNSIEPDSNGNVTLSIPSKTSDLTNDSGYITASQVPSAPVQSVNGKTGAVVLDASDVGALPDDTVIPAAVTEQDVAGWGFTKNTGTYSKPSSGIPASDLASGVIPDISGKVDKITNFGLAKIAENEGNFRISVREGENAAINALVVSVGTFSTTMQQAMTALAGKADASSVYTKTEVDQKLVGAMDYKGTKATVSALPTSGNKTGDVWHITADGSEWAWNGSAWEELGTAIDLSGYATEQWVENKGYLTQHQSLTAYQTQAIIDAGGYYSTDTVEGALAEIGAELAGINTLIGTGVIS